MTRLALVSPYALDVPGGVQDQVLGLAEHLRDRGVDVSVIGPRTDGTGVSGVRRVRANGSVAPISLDAGSWKAVRSALRGFDVIHVHEPLMPLVSWAALSVPAARKVVTFHADPSAWIRMLYRVIRPKWMVGRNTTIVAVSATAAGALDWLPDVRVIPNAVRAIRSSEPRDFKQVTFLGRDEPRKGLAVLLGAWTAVRAQHPDANLVVMGTEGRDGDGVTFLGRVDEPTKDTQLAATGVFCAPNLGGESFGITVVEAMSAGCAVVASDLPAFRDVLGESGTWFTPGDSAALADQIARLLGDLDEVRLRGRQARNRSLDYSWDRVTDAYMELYGIDSAK